VSKCYANACNAIQELASDHPSPASISFIDHGAQWEGVGGDDAISSLCALSDFFIEEPSSSPSSEAAVLSAAAADPLCNDKTDAGAKRVRSSADAAASRTRGKK